MAYECCGSETRASTFNDILGALKQLLTLTIYDYDDIHQTTGNPTAHDDGDSDTQTSSTSSIAGHYYHSMRSSLNTVDASVVVTGAVLMACGLLIVVVQRRRLADMRRQRVS